MLRETLDRLWAQLDMTAPWKGTLTVLTALLVLLVLRRFLDHDARGRVRMPAGFLVAALVFRASAWAAASAGSGSASVLGLLAVLCFVVGMVALVGLIVFDVVFRRHPVPAVLRDLAQFVVVLAIFAATLHQHGLDPISLVATGSVLTAVVGFALQGTIANVFAGLALPLEGEFTIGDWIEVGGHVGRIREIKWRSTALVTKDGDTVIVPNNLLITTSVKNYSRPTTAHRVAIRVGFHDRHAPNDVRAMVLDAVRRVPGVLDEPPPDCLAVEFGDDSISYTVRFWIDGFVGADPIAAEVRTRLWYASRRAGFEMPSPSTTVVMQTAGMEDGAPARMKALDRVDLFGPLDRDCRAHVANGLRAQHFGAGEDIIRQDAPGDSLFIIDRGLVEVRVQVDGAHRSLAQLGPGKFFGEMSLMTGERRQATCTAVTDTVCYVLDQAAFRYVLDTRPSLAEDISTILAGRQGELTASRDDLSAEARLRRTRETRSRLLDAIRRAFEI